MLKTHRIIPRRARRATQDRGTRPSIHCLGRVPEWSQRREATSVGSGSRHPKSRLPTPSRRPGAQPVSLRHGAATCDRSQVARPYPEGAEICENRKPHSISSAHRSTPVTRTMALPLRLTASVPEAVSSSAEPVSPSNQSKGRRSCRKAPPVQLTGHCRAPCASWKRHRGAKQDTVVAGRGSKRSAAQRVPPRAPRRNTATRDTTKPASSAALLGIGEHECRAERRSRPARA